MEYDNATLENLDFDGDTFKQCKLSNCRLTNCEITYSHLECSQLVHCRVERCVLIDTNVGGEGSSVRDTYIRIGD